MANSVTARFNDDCKVFVSMSDDTTVEKAVIIDAEGNETDIGGGGGSSDFSTAEVTITLTENSSTYYWSLPVISDNPKKIIVNNYEQSVGEPVTNKVPLYGGVLEIYFPPNNDTITNVTGSATLENNILTITGDCAFTRGGGSY